MRKCVTRTSALVVAFSAAVSFGGRSAEACTPPPPDAAVPDAAFPAGDVIVSWRDLAPRVTAYGSALPSNMSFVVTYSVAVLKDGASLDWLGELALRAKGGAAILADVVRLDSGFSSRVAFRMTAHDLLPSGIVEVTDRFVTVPCGTSAACAKGEAVAIGSFWMSGGADLMKPVLPDRSLVINGWKTYGYVETCQRTLCAGFTIDAQFPPAVDSDTPPEGITYRTRYPDGTTVDTERLWVGTSIECTQCFHLPRLPPAETAKTQLGPIVISAIDWMGHESDGRLTVTIAPPPACDRLLVGDGGVSILDAPLAANADAPVTSPSPGGCATAGGRGSPFLLLGLLALVRRARHVLNEGS